MKRGILAISALAIGAGLTLAAGTVGAAGVVSNELMARVRSIAPGGQQFQVTDRQGNIVQVVRPARPPQASSISLDGALANTSALRAGDTVLLTGLGHGSWFSATGVEVLTGERAGGATAAAPILRFQGFISGRALRAVSPDGTEYRIVFPPRPQEINFRKEGNLAELSALREGDFVIPQGATVDHTIVATRLDALQANHLGSGAPVPLLLTYRGSPGWRLLTGEAADGTRYLVRLPHRPQALYFVRNGALVETSTLKPGGTIEVQGYVHDREIDARQVVLH